MNDTNWPMLERQVLRKLKPFQLETVNWAFRQLYPRGAGQGSRRFLVADEVGLGKTLVAKGILIKTLALLAPKQPRVNIVYICSNREIAKQNLARLKIGGMENTNFLTHDRLTLLPLIEQGIGAGGGSALKAEGINMIALTPGTSLELRDGTGHVRERALIYLLLRDAFIGINETKLRNLLHANASAESFKAEIGRIDEKFRLDARLQMAFVTAIRTDRPLFAKLDRLAKEFERKLLKRRHKALYAEAAELIGQLRHLLAQECIAALNPDLIILDEFQRFAHLLTPEQHELDNAELAQLLFRYKDEHAQVRLLLLSATPYRMFSVSSEKASDQHHAEFIKTTEFLLADQVAAAQLKVDLANFNTRLFSLHDRTEEGMAGTIALRKQIEQQLRLVMSRTERVSATEARDGMIRTIVDAAVVPDANDILAYRAMQGVADQINQADMLEYWKAAPYPLSFLKDYGWHQQFKTEAARGQQGLHQKLQVPGLMLPAKRLGSNGVKHIPNGRTRRLAQSLLEAGMGKMLWLAPSLPYYKLGGSYAEHGPAAGTKRLIFSRWRMVPRALASTISAAFIHELEQLYSSRHAGGIDNLVGSLQFYKTGGGAFALRYPCQSLATLLDPLRLGQVLFKSGLAPDWSQVVAAGALELAGVLKPLAVFEDQSLKADEQWYWLAPVLLDMQRDETGWHAWFRGIGSKGPGLDAALAESIGEAIAELLSGSRRLGRMPDDLAATLAEIACAAPGTCALRGLIHTFRHKDLFAMSSAAADIAAHFQRYFNTHDSALLIRAVAPDTTAPYWRQVLWYSGEACLQAVIDEYIHVLGHDKPHDPDKQKAASGAAAGPWDSIAGGFAVSLGLMQTTLFGDRLDHDLDPPAMVQTPCPIRHARPLLEDRHPQDSAHASEYSSAERLRDAFNSPFLPFVLVSTSVGQEGLDFHWYCHAIVHWNLPWNPIDLEQRDGRIHRFQNHAVRKNLAHDIGPTILRTMRGNPWPEIIKRAESHMGNVGDGMKPCWLYRRGDITDIASPGFAGQFSPGRGAAIERHIPMIPFSSDIQRYDRLQNALVTYRLVFGQPRQEELLNYLQESIASEELKQHIDKLAIDLRPR